MAESRLERAAVERKGEWIVAVDVADAETDDAVAIGEPAIERVHGGADAIGLEEHIVCAEDGVAADKPVDCVIERRGAAGEAVGAGVVDAVDAAEALVKLLASAHGFEISRGHTEANGVGVGHDRFDHRGEFGGALEARAEDIDGAIGRCGAGVDHAAALSVGAERA